MTAIAARTVLAAREGDEEAFARLVDLESAPAYRLALSIIHSPSDAEDVVQEAFVIAWRRMDSLRDPDRWSAWFRRLLVRCAIDRARRRSRVKEVDLDLADEISGIEPALGVDRIALLDSFARLDPSDRAILALRYFTDLELQDVADTLGIRLGTTKSRLHRAIGRLRKELELER